MRPAGGGRHSMKLSSILPPPASDPFPLEVLELLKEARLRLRGNLAAQRSAQLLDRAIEKVEEWTTETD